MFYFIDFLWNFFIIFFSNWTILNCAIYSGNDKLFLRINCIDDVDKKSVDKNILSFFYSWNFKINFINWEIAHFAAFYGNFEAFTIHSSKYRDRNNNLDNI